MRNDKENAPEKDAEDRPVTTITYDKTINKDGAAEKPEPATRPKNRFLAFITGYGGAIGVVVALLLVTALVLLAILMNGDLYDKAAFFWILAFLAELGYYMLAKKSRGTLIAMIVTGALAAVFAALYGLELGGILP